MHSSSTITRAMEQKKSGLLIVLEGIDGVGKTTLARNIANELHKKNIPTLLTKEPGATPFGTELRTILSNRTCPVDPVAEFLLFSADRAQHIRDVVIPALQQDIIVISDRMADSSRAYQGFGRGIDSNVIETVTACVMRGLQPDITFYIALDPARAFERIASRGQQRTDFEQEHYTFFTKVVEGFETLCARRKDMIKLDGLLSQQELVNVAMQKIQTMIGY
jgi:dTMP kinase